MGITEALQLQVQKRLHEQLEDWLVYLLSLIARSLHTSDTTNILVVDSQIGVQGQTK